MIQTTEPRATARIRYADSRTRSMIAPDMIDAVVHEKRRNARKKTRLKCPVRLLSIFGPSPELQGAVSPQNPGTASGLACPFFGQPSSKQP